MAEEATRPAAPVACMLAKEVPAKTWTACQEQFEPSRWPLSYAGDHSTTGVAVAPHRRWLQA